MIGQDMIGYADLSASLGWIFSVLVYPFPACHQNEEKKSVLVSFSEHFRSGSVLVSTFFFWFLLWFPSGILYSKTKRLMTTSNKTDFSFFFCCSWFPFWFRPAPGLGFHSGSSLNEIFRSGSGLLWTPIFFFFCVSVLVFRSGSRLENRRPGWKRVFRPIRSGRWKGMKHISFPISKSLHS